LRTHAADRRFVIGRDPDVSGLVWAAGLGGHGITCGSPVGEIAAAAVLDRKMPADLVEPFSPARFAAAEARRS
jgi:glycine/D-amino acid oxidase-like deaminating enzyme